ncbi:MAG: hypothetical protein EBY16_06815, partial [Gammaproteobacteria bacterium]|nr:hypothetical protein [Gammaproteobacteria bacterium]
MQQSSENSTSELESFDDLDVTSDISLALAILQGVDILNQVNREALIAHANPFELAKVFSMLQQAGIFLSQETIDTVFAHPNPDDLDDSLAILQHAHILTQANFDTLILHDNPYFLALALSSLQRDGILSQENRDAVIDHPNPDDMARALSDLHRAQNLISENPSHVFVGSNADDLDWYSPGISLELPWALTQANFDAVIADAHLGHFAGVQGEDLAGLARNRESSMVDLNEAQRARLEQTSKRYGPLVAEAGGAVRVMDELRREIQARYDADAASIKRANGSSAQLPCAWDAFEALSLSAA